MNCTIKGCKRNDIEIYYYGKAICYYHWDIHCNKNKKFDIKRRLGIKDEKDTQMTL